LARGAGFKKLARILIEWPNDNMSGPATNTLPPLQALTIHLLRDIPDPLKAISRLSQRIEIDSNHTLYVKRTKAHHPSWVTFFGGRVNPNAFGKVRSSGALLLCPVAGRYFAITFGTGRYLLDPLFIEQRFGLLTTLNAVDPRKVKSIDKASLDRQGMQSRTQASRDASARDFGLDIEQDLVRAVAGIPIDGLIGETIAGFDSLHVNVRVTFPELRDRLKTYLAKSREQTYQQEFGWIDHVREVRDDILNEQLMRHLVQELKSVSPKDIWLAPDAILDWNEISYFQFGSAQSAPRFPTLSLHRFLESVGEVKKLKPEDLTRRRIRALRADDTVAHEWPALRCLQAEMQLHQKSYLLSSGKWYRIDDGFVESIDEVVRSIPVVPLGFPEYQDANEGVYNERVVRASQNRLVLFDADTIWHGGGRSQIEFCDLYSFDRDMIHIKRYSSSATLSHLFSQAAVSGQNFKSDAEFRRKVNEKLPPSHQIADVDQPLEREEYQVVIGIIGGPGTADKLPFFFTDNVEE
jgi:uncharacterized protein (TIGR04141 family)